MADLDYSVDALNAKNAFYRANAIVYVEGEDDVLFWEELFSKVPDFSAVIESVGGSSNLQKHIVQIEAGTLDAIAARDADFLRFQGSTANSTRVIYTPGYSIENSLYTAEVIHQIARTWCKSPEVTNEYCTNWLSELGDAFIPLIELDIANALSNAGVAVLADSCTRFMTGQTSAIACSDRIAAYATDITLKIPKPSIAKAKKALAKSSVPPTEILRGHLLATAVLKFILQTAKSLGKKINISMDSLYAAAMPNFVKLFGSSHPHRNYYTTAIDNAVASFR
jgi:Protein of unknown function (DUF4435)